MADLTTLELAKRLLARYNPDRFRTGWNAKDGAGVHDVLAALVRLAEGIERDREINGYEMRPLLEAQELICLMYVHGGAPAGLTPPQRRVLEAALRRGRA